MNSAYPALPVLDRAGQQAFWNRQASTFDETAMTNDNPGELVAVRAFCAEYLDRGYRVEDIVALGGATGCRDPHVVLMEVLGRINYLPNIIHNDLSADMVERAVRKLSRMGEGALSVTGIPGAIHEIAHRIPSMPRRAIIGAYAARALVEKHSTESGLQSYLDNHHIVGDHLAFQALGVPRGFYGEPYRRIDIMAGEGPARTAAVLEELALWQRDPSLGAIRVIGQHAGKPGYFLSHWFTKQGLRAMLEACFPAERVATMVVSECSKGFVVCIDPVERPRGIVTLLNNVIGNIIPDEQAETLQAVHRMSS